MRELTVDMLEDSGPTAHAGLAGTSKGTGIAKLAHFLREAYRRGSMTERSSRSAAIRRSMNRSSPIRDKEVTAIRTRPERSRAGRRVMRSQAATSGSWSS